MANNNSTQVTDIEAPEAPSMDIISMISPMVLIFIVFYFLMIRPQNKKKTEQDSMIARLKVGEKIVTNSGIFGIVSRIDGDNDTIMITVSKDVEIKILKTVIANVVTRDKKDKADKDKIKDKKIKTDQAESKDKKSNNK